MTVWPNDVAIVAMPATLSKDCLCDFCFISYIVFCTLMLFVYGWTESFGVFITGMGFAAVAILLLLIEGFVTLCYSEKGEWRRYDSNKTLGKFTCIP